MSPKILIEKFLANEPINLSELSSADKISLAYDLCMLQAKRGTASIAKAASTGESMASRQRRINELLERLQRGE